MTEIIIKGFMLLIDKIGIFLTISHHNILLSNKSIVELLGTPW